MKISFVVATFGRKLELYALFDSLRNMKVAGRSCQVILVDQNTEGFLAEFIGSYSDVIDKYILSDKKGLSYNRNVGLKYVEGDVVCFPDDDCYFYSDTFDRIEHVFENSNSDFCLGRIFDRDRGVDVIKRWPKAEFKPGLFSSYFINSSITMFVRKDSIIFFDENLGVGAQYGSCEDADYLYRLISSGASGIYSPLIEVWHPEADLSKMDLNKVRNYASGFGYYIRKDLFSVKILLLLLLVFKKLIQFVGNVYTNKFPIGYFSSFCNGLLKGLFKR